MPEVGDRSQHYVLMRFLHVAEKLNGGKVVLDLPDEVRQKDQQGDQPAEPDPRSQEFTA